MRKLSWFIVAAIAALPSELCAQESPRAVQGDTVIHAPAGGSEIKITTTSRLSGAIHSLTWDGQEFIDSADHGRQLQSAANFDLGQPFFPETFNPTEAGSRADGAGNKSSSRLLKIQADKNRLETTTQMAFWLAPGERSEGRLAINQKVLSDHMLKKRVQLGYQDLPHVIDYEVTFTIPAGERHQLAQFEALTGYMPPEFEKFWGLDLETGKWKELDDGPGEQALPVALSTADGKFAMGVISPEPVPEGTLGPGYGRFRFRAEKVVKWNCVFRVRNAEGVPPGDFRFRQFVAVGTLEDVRRVFVALRDQTPEALSEAIMRSFPESDWKLFRKVKEAALNLYCERFFAEFAQIANDSSQSAHARYLAAYQLVKQRDRRLELIFDGMSRSGAAEQLAAMVHDKLVTEEELAEFSQETREFVDRYLQFSRR